MSAEGEAKTTTTEETKKEEEGKVDTPKEEESTATFEPVVSGRTMASLSAPVSYRTQVVRGRSVELLLVPHSLTCFFSLFSETMRACALQVKLDEVEVKSGEEEEVNG